jgi:hypothetical protein
MTPSSIFHALINTEIFFVAIIIITTFIVLITSWFYFRKELKNE